MSVAFIGLGNFGGPIACNLARRGYSVTGVVWPGHRSPGAAMLREAGGSVGGPANVTDNDLLVLCLPRPSNVRDILLRATDVLPRLVIDMGTGEPEQTRSLAAEMAAVGTTLVDAPVSGSLASAAQGELVVFVGARKDEVEGLHEFLTDVGSTIGYFDKRGVGHAAKLVNQLIHLTNMGVLAEGLSLARALGVPIQTLVPTLQKSSASSAMLARFGDTIVSGDHPPQFTLDMARKDLDLVRQAADATAFQVGYLDETRSLYGRGAELGFGRENFSAICKATDVVAGSTYSKGMRP